MSFKATCYRIPPLLFSLLLSGCASQLQKTLDRSIMIEERCTAIEQALPMTQKKLEDALIDAVALRLVGSCLDDSQLCLDPGPDEKMPPTLATSAQQLLESLKKQQLVLQKVGQKTGKEVQETVALLQSDYDHLHADLIKTQDLTARALRNLHSELRRTKEHLTPLVYNNKPCNQRTDCLTAFAQQIASHEETLSQHIEQLKIQAARLAELGQQAQATGNRGSMLLLQQIPTATDSEGEAQLAANAELQNNGRQLEERARQLGKRLNNGARTLGSLFSHDVQIAASDLMAARLYEKGADRLLAVIDRMLSQLDRTIDKVDDHAYGGASIVMQVFAGDTQEQFDRIFFKLFADRYPSKTAQLAFASAACRRLGMGKDAPVQNASMFSPFLYATLTRVEYEISTDKDKTTLKAIRASWEKKVGKTAQQLQEEKIIDTTSAFQTAATKAYQEESEPKDGSAPSAPSMLQQVALCAGVEQQLALKDGLSATALKDSTLAACGSAAMDAALAAQALTKAGSQPRAQLAIDAAPKATHEATSGYGNGAVDAKAWRDAMEAILAASAAKKPGPFDALCKQIANQIKGSRCTDGIADSATLDFDATFAMGQVRDKVLELQLAQLADVLYRNQQNFRLGIEAYASRKPPHCPASLPPAKKVPCAAEKNEALARSRADWAFDVLKQRMGARFVPGNHKRGSVNPLSYDTPADRRLRITLWRYNDR